MPGQEHKREFDRIVERLRADDPQFASRVDGGLAGETTEPLEPPPPPVMSRVARRVHAALAGIVALFSVVVGGWTGLIIAIALTVWAVRLMLADRPDRG